MKTEKLSLVDISQIALFTALIAVMAQISIPLPGGVPLTLQTLAIPLAGLVLGPKKGTLSTIVYVLLGAVGAPVFANFTGGIGIVLGMTGGFLLSFPIMALLAGFASGKNAKSPILWMWLLAGAVINYIVGTLWFMFAAKANLMGALTACVIPFIPTAIIKMILAGMLGPMLRGVLIKSNLLKPVKSE